MWKYSELCAFYRKVSVLVKFTLNSLYVFSLVNGFRSISDIWIVLYQKKDKSWVWWWLWLNAVQVLDTC